MKIVTTFICLSTFDIARCVDGAPTPETTFSTDKNAMINSFETQA